MNLWRSGTPLTPRASGYDIKGLFRWYTLGFTEPPVPPPAVFSLQRMERVPAENRIEQVPARKRF